MLVGGIAIGLIGLVILEAILLLSLVVWERPYSALLSFLVSAGIADFFFGTHFYTTVWNYPVAAVGLVLAYIAAGVIWSFPKWWFYVRKVRDVYNESLSNFKKTVRLVPGQKLTDDQFARFYSSYGFDPDGHNWHFEPWSKIMPLQASKNKNKILVWMMYWPFSLVWTLIDEPFKKAFQFIFENIKGIYQGISEKAFAGVELYDPKHREE